jgi:phage terminase Nu1 subunit (DNA packaging protein)
MKSSAEIEELVVSRAELARCLGLSGSRVGQLVEEKAIPAPETHGTYKLAASTRAYCRYQRDTGGEKSKAGADFSAARAEWMRSTAAKAKLELQARSDEFVPMEAVTEAWCAIGTVMRQRYLAVPNQLAARHAVLDTPQKLFDAAMEEINLVLEALNKSDGSELNYLFEAENENKSADT